MTTFCNLTAFVSLYSRVTSLVWFFCYFGEIAASSLHNLGDPCTVCDAILLAEKMRHAIKMCHCLMVAEAIFIDTVDKLFTLCFDTE
jgi:hypothetical protein